MTNKIEIEAEVEKLLRWYDKNKPEFTSRTYLKEGGFFTKLGFPYKDLNDSAILKKEISFNVKVLGRLREVLHLSETPVSDEAFDLFVLCLKNRSEHMASESDFYPIFIVLATFGFTMLTLDMAASFKFLFACVTIIFVYMAAFTRVQTRRKVADLKELINIVDAFKRTPFSKKSLPMRETHTNCQAAR